jgi:hypothetical protein
MANINSLRKLSDNDKTTAKRGNSFQVIPSAIMRQDGFNVRDAFDPDYWERPETIEYIEGFAQSYLTGNRFVLPIVVQVINGVPYIRDGEHRYRGLMLAIERGAKYEFITVLESAGDEADQAMLLLDSNNGLKVNAVGTAVVYGRLRSYGWSVEQIATKRNKSPAHVYQHLTVLDMPLELKRMIQNDEVRASDAIDLFAKHDGQAVIDMLRGVQAQQGGTGSRVKRSQMPTTVRRPPAKLVKPVVSMFKTFNAERITDDTYSIVLNREQYDAFVAAQQGISEYE